MEQSTFSSPDTRTFEADSQDNRDSLRLGARGWEQNAIIKALRADHINLRTRLLSIEHDSRCALALYEKILGKFSFDAKGHPSSDEPTEQPSIDSSKTDAGNNIPIFGNARAGSWYVPTTMNTYSVDTCAFKSADGHYGHWAASPRRPNIHVLRSLLRHGAVVVVDVTRSGKRIPDSLSKTIPIWCAVLTTLMRRPECENHKCETQASCSDCQDAMGMALYVHPSIPASERDIIMERIPHFVAAWRAAGMHRHPVLRMAAHRARTWSRSTRKRESSVEQKECGSQITIRPLWTQPSRVTWENGIPLADLEYMPVICMSASDAVQSGNRMLIEAGMNAFVESTVAGIEFPMRPSFAYVQGAGDDEEAWSNGLTPGLFWRYRHKILKNGDGDSKNGGNDDVVQSVHDLMMNSTCGLDEYNIATMSPMAVWDSHVSIACLPSKGFAHVLAGLKEYKHVDSIILLVGGAETTLLMKQMKEENEDEDDQQSNSYRTAARVKLFSLTNHKGKTDYKHAFARVLGPCLWQMRECCIDRGRKALVACTSEGGDWTAGLVIAWLAWHCDFIDGSDGDSEIDGTESDNDNDKDYNDDGIIKFNDDEPLYRLSTGRRDGMPVVDKQDVHKTMMHFLATFPRFQISRATLKQLNRFFSSPCPPSTVTSTSTVYEKNSCPG